MHMVGERITVLPQHSEGGQPRWACTNPTDQFTVGVRTWRRISGSLIEVLFNRVNDSFPFNALRARLVVDDWPGAPVYVELYDVIGDINQSDDLADRLAQTEALMGALKRMGITQ